jgi:hypothetical protein
MSPSLHVLCVGSGLGPDAVRDALARHGGCRLLVAPSFFDLFDISREDTVRIAILHCSLSAAQLREACAYIRRTWPHARIVVLGAGVEGLDDPLYDERVPPETPSGRLLGIIERLGAGAPVGEP